MNEKLKEFLDAKKDTEQKKYEKEKQRTLLELGLYEKVYAPTVGYGHIDGDNKVVKFPITNKNTKIGDIIKVSISGEKVDVIIDKIESEYSEEFSSSEWDSASSTNKYYKKVPVEITDEEYQEVKKYSKGDVLVQNNNPIATTLRVIAVLVYIVGFIGGIVIGDAVAEYSWEFSWGTAFIYWFVSFFSGTTILGFAEIIQLLHDIKNK